MGVDGPVLNPPNLILILRHWAAKNRTTGDAVGDAVQSFVAKHYVDRGAKPYTLT